MISQDRREALLERLAALPPARREALRRSLSGDAAGQAWPLSSGQERLWFLNRFDPGDTAYHVPWCVRLSGPLDESALAGAFTTIVARHEVLRTRFVQRGDRPVQVVAPASPVVIERLDQDQNQDAVIAAVARRPFDLEAGPPMRVALLRLGTHDAVLCIVLHHIVADAWSLDVLMRELAECYAAAREGREPRLDELPMQYRQHAVADRERNDTEGAAHLAYWSERLAGVPALDLPSDRPRPRRWRGAGGRLPVSVPDEDTSRLERFARQRRSTLFMALLAAYQATLGRAAGQHDFCVGVPVAGRDRTELAPMIGYFGNTLVSRADLSGDPTFGELLGRTRSATLRGLQHAAAPYEEVLRAVRPDRDLSRPPLCQVMFNLSHNLPKADLLRQDMADLGVEVYPPPDLGRTRAEVFLDLHRGPEGLGGSMEYDSDLFSAGTARRLAAAFTDLVVRAGADPDFRLSDVKGA